MAQTVEQFQEKLDEKWSALFKAEKEAEQALRALLNAALEKIKADQALGKAAGEYDTAKARALEKQYISLLQRDRLCRHFVKRLTDTTWLGRFLSLV